MVDRKADVIVIGGGLHGLSAALHLSLRGASVIVLEKDYSGRHASGVNAGGVLGRSRVHETVFHSFGYSYHGFQLSPVTGRVIADLIASGRTDLSIGPFDVGRFERDEQRPQ